MRARPCGAPRPTSCSSRRCQPSRSVHAHAPLRQQGRDRALGGIGGLPPRPLVVDDVTDGLHRVGLGVADQADRSALDPAGRIHAGHTVVGVLPQRLTLVVRDHAVALVERHARQRRPEVAHGAVDRLDGHLPDLAGADHAALAVGPGALPAERRDAAVVIRDDRERLRVEVQVQTTGCLSPGVVDRGALAPGLQHAVDHHDLLVAGDRSTRRVVVVEVLVVDDHVDVAQLAEFAQLEGRELDLGGAAAAEHVHVGDR